MNEVVGFNPAWLRAGAACLLIRGHCGRIRYRKVPPDIAEAKADTGLPAISTAIAIRSILSLRAWGAIHLVEIALHLLV